MYLGIDTSNYTTSAAVFDGKSAFQSKKLLAVKHGERGLRQSDALFQHTVNLPSVIGELELGGSIEAVGVSTAPRNVSGSYMPCFLAGVSAACAASKAAGVPLYKTSHQTGHILAALFSAGRLDLINQKFIAFHVSGGTTEALLVTPDSDDIISAGLIAQSSDLKAGQAIDRAGVMMGLDFPCGRELDDLSQKSDAVFKIRPSMNGTDCSLSGIENKARKMLEINEPHEDIAKYVLSAVSAAVCEMTQRLLQIYGRLPVIYAGGVMSNTLIKSEIAKRFDSVYFAEPQFSCDNAVGVAAYAYIKENGI